MGKAANQACWARGLAGASRSWGRGCRQGGGPGWNWDSLPALQPTSSCRAVALEAQTTDSQLQVAVPAWVWTARMSQQSSCGCRGRGAGVALTFACLEPARELGTTSISFASPDNLQTATHLFAPPSSSHISLPAINTALCPTSVVTCHLNLTHIQTRQDG